MKILAYIFVFIVAFAIINFWFQIYILGNYYSNAGFAAAAAVGIIPVFIIYLSIQLIKFINKN